MIRLIHCLFIFALGFVCKAYSTKGFGFSTRLKTPKLSNSKLFDDVIVPSRGIVPGLNSKATSPDKQTNNLQYFPPSTSEILATKFNLWTLFPWNHINGKIILKAKIGGDLPLDAPPPGLFNEDHCRIHSINELFSLFNYAAFDPRVKGVFIELDGLSCGYAKLTEISRYMNYFRQSGKRIIGYSTYVSEKEYYLSRQFDEYYVPPDAIINLRGFSTSNPFFRGLLDKIGIEPQVQRIGKYKSFGDTYNRQDMSEEQREVVSSLLTEVSQFWLQEIAYSLHTTIEEISQLWSSNTLQTTSEIKSKHMITSIKYYDQVETLIRYQLREKKEFSWIGLIDKWLFQSKLDIASNTTEFIPFLQNIPLASNDLNHLHDFNITEDFENYPPRRLAYFMNKNTNNETNNQVNKQVNNETNHEITLTAIQEKDSNETMTTKPLSEPPFIVQALTNNSINKKKTWLDEIQSSLAQNLFVYPYEYPSQSYLSKMRKGANFLKGLQILEVHQGPRIGIINAMGQIVDGRSTQSSGSGSNIGAENIIELIQFARDNEDIKAVVLRIDSPGGSALASDLVWRELRSLSKRKPVIASMIDVAASGGYYFSMGCDAIVAEEMTLTGSIGVVAAKFNAQELLKKLSLNVETLSIGKYAELMSLSRGFTSEEAKLFEEMAYQSYQSFVKKAAVSRNMSYDSMHEVAQGRVWTGRQAHERGLVDFLGGLFKSLEIAQQLTYPSLKVDNNTRVEYRIEHITPMRLFLARLGLPGLVTNSFQHTKKQFSTSPTMPNFLRSLKSMNQPMYLASEEVYSSGLVGSSSLGIDNSIGLPPQVMSMLKVSGLSDIIQPLLSQETFRQAMKQPSVFDILEITRSVLDKL